MALLRTLVGLVLCVGFPAVALAAPAAAPPVHPAPPPGQVGPSPGYARPPVYPAAVPAPQIADKEQGRAPPPAPPQRRKFGLAVAGVAMFGAGYLGSLLSLVASSAASDGASPIGPEMMIPIAGPWLTLSATNWDAVAESQRATARSTLVLQGVLQGVGAVLATIGIAQYVATTPPENERQRPRAHALSFQLGPTNGGAFGMIRGAF